MNDERQPIDGAPGGDQPIDEGPGGDQPMDRVRTGDQKMVEVFRTSDPAVAPVIRSLFAASDIPFEIEGEEIMGLFPIGEFIGGGRRRHLDTIFRVPEGYADEAASLLQWESEPEAATESEAEPVAKADCGPEAEGGSEGPAR